MPVGSGVVGGWLGVGWGLEWGRVSLMIVIRGHSGGRVFSLFGKEVGFGFFGDYAVNL